jgi:plasmid stabilization system protein ParE
MHRIVWRASAAAEAAEAAAWYERERSGLGAEFVSALDAALGQIADRPLSFPRVAERVHRGRLRRFPYGVFFAVRRDRVEVLALYHDRRRPRRVRA